MTDDLRRESMEQRIKGTADSAKGNLKEAAGKVFDREDWEAEGKMDQLKGKVRSGAGRVGQDLSDAADELTKRDDRDHDR